MQFNSSCSATYSFYELFMSFEIRRKSIADQSEGK